MRAGLADGETRTLETEGCGTQGQNQKQIARALGLGMTTAECVRGWRMEKPAPLKPKGAAPAERTVPRPTRRHPSKIPIGVIETLRLVLPNTAAILGPLAAATLRAAGNPR